MKRGRINALGKAHVTESGREEGATLVRLFSMGRHSEFRSSHKHLSHGYNYTTYASRQQSVAFAETLRLGPASAITESGEGAGAEQEILAPPRR